MRYKEINNLDATPYNHLAIDNILIFYGVSYNGMPGVEIRYYYPDESIESGINFKAISLPDDGFHCLINGILSMTGDEIKALAIKGGYKEEAKE